MVLTVLLPPDAARGRGKEGVCAGQTTFPRKFENTVDSWSIGPSDVALTPHVGDWKYSSVTPSPKDFPAVTDVANVERWAAQWLRAW